MLPFFIAQEHSAMHVLWRALTFPWLLTLCYEATLRRLLSSEVLHYSGVDNWGSMFPQFLNPICDSQRPISICLF